MRILLSLLTLVAMLAHASDARAYKTMGIRWSDSKMPVAWSLDVDGVDNLTTSADNDEVKRAVKAWHDVDCSRLTFGTPSVLPAGSGQNATGDGVNKVFWVESGWEHGDYTLGVTTPKYSGSQIFDADIEFNGVNYNWSAGQGSYCSNCTDTFSIALHEFGHFFGLDHSTTNSAIMFASYPGSPKQALHADDVAGICALYPKPQPNSVPQGGACTQSSDCLTGQSLTCATTQAGDARICTKTCTGTSDTSCPAEYECRAASTGFACFEKQTGTGAGGEDEACGTSIGGCSEGLMCAGTSGTSGTCQRLCNPSAPSCPSGKTCYPTEGGGGVCVAGGGSGGEGDLCGSTGCSGTLQCVGNSAADARCRRACTVGATNACPVNFDCVPLNGGSGACVPSATPTGAAECQTCGQGVSCGSGLACVLDSDGQSRCRKGCLEDNACGVTNRCIARNDVPGATAACACPGVAVDARAEGEACADSDECAANAICIRDGEAGAACRTTCNPDAPSCEDPKVCTAVGAAHICVRPVETPDAGTDVDEGRVAGTCGDCASGGVEAFALVALFGLLRRRRISRG